MKIILSRKGFDSQYGGCPSPIFPDGSLLSLPIPDKNSQIQYNEIAGNHWSSIGDTVSQLRGIPATHRAHLDPDLNRASISRQVGWRPIFGQAGSAEGHLRRQQIAAGDIFLYFGLFRPVEFAGSNLQFVPGTKPIHALFGWLQIAERVPLSAWPDSESWAKYHPHFSRKSERNNVLYLSTDRLVLPHNETQAISGAGTFRAYSESLRLTAPGSSRPSLWLLPAWFFPEGRGSCLSYHSNPSRWAKGEGGVLLSSVSRGQEFVLDCDHFPEALVWLQGLLNLVS
jgi:hypothetical protein